MKIQITFEILPIEWETKPTNGDGFYCKELISKCEKFCIEYPLNKGCPYTLYKLDNSKYWQNIGEFKELKAAKLGWNDFSLINIANYISKFATVLNTEKW